MAKHGAPQSRHSLLSRARQLRREMTFPERLLWSHLRARQAGGMKWRRQVPIDRYVVDFYCPAASLVVEVDGMSHAGQAEADAARTFDLQAQGLRVLRVTNDDVIADVDGVVEYIIREVRESLP